MDRTTQWKSLRGEKLGWEGEVCVCARVGGGSSSLLKVLDLYPGLQLVSINPSALATLATDVTSTHIFCQKGQ